MANMEIKHKGSIGTSSLILIFIVLCLATFGMLSLSSAAGDLKLAQRNAAAVQQYYQADVRGEAFVVMAEARLQEIRQQTGDAGDRKILYRRDLGDYYREDTGTIETDIPMEYGQALHVKLQLEDGTEPCAVSGWQVYNREDYGIDDSMPVWTGDGQN